MNELIQEIVTSYGLLAILLLMMSNGIASTPPSELILAIGGIWASSKNINLSHVIIAGSIGNTLGAIILYVIGYYYGLGWLINFKRCLEAQDNKILKNVGSLVPKAEQLRIYKAFFNENAILWVGVLRCFPAVRAIVSFPAGVIKMSVIVFLSVSIVGISIWASFWVSIGFILNKAWVEIIGPSFVVFMAAFSILLIIVYRKYKRYSAKVIAQKVIESC